MTSTRYDVGWPFKLVRASTAQHCRICELQETLAKMMCGDLSVLLWVITPSLKLSSELKTLQFHSIPSVPSSTQKVPRKPTFFVGIHCVAQIEPLG